jgi:hypothetical protein
MANHRRLPRGINPGSLETARETRSGRRATGAAIPPNEQPSPASSPPPPSPSPPPPPLSPPLTPTTHATTTATATSTMLASTSAIAAAGFAATETQQEDIDSTEREEKKTSDDDGSNNPPYFDTQQEDDDISEREAKKTNNVDESNKGLNSDGDTEKEGAVNSDNQHLTDHNKESEPQKLHEEHNENNNRNTSEQPPNVDSQMIDNDDTELQKEIAFNKERQEKCKYSKVKKEIVLVNFAHTVICNMFHKYMNVMTFGQNIGTIKLNPETLKQTTTFQIKFSVIINR